MNEEFVKAGSEMAEEVVESAVENLDTQNLKYLGAFGAGVIVGIVAYKKALAPAIAWVQEKRKPKVIVLNKKTKKPEKDAVDMEPIEDDSQE